MSGGGDDWSGEGGNDDFPDDVYSASFPSSDPTSDSNSEKWGVSPETEDDQKWDTFTPDETPNYDSANESFSKETQDTWGQAKSVAVPGAKPPQLSIPTQLPQGAIMICPLIGTVDMIRGGVLGMIFGSLSGVTAGYSSGLRGPLLRQYILNNARASAFSFSLWLGTFSGSKCAFAVMRGKKDSVNSFAGGVVAGVAASIRSRNPRAMLVTGCVSGVLAAVIDSL